MSETNEFPELSTFNSLGCATFNLHVQTSQLSRELCANKERILLAHFAGWSIEEIKSFAAKGFSKQHNDIIIKYFGGTPVHMAKYDAYPLPTGVLLFEPLEIVLEDDSFYIYKVKQNYVFLDFDEKE
jgi:hypothetical protein